MAKDLFSKKNQFSIRKLTVGVCSVIIGMSFLTPQEAAANELTTEPTNTGLTPLADSEGLSEDLVDDQASVAETSAELAETTLAEAPAELQASPAIATRAAGEEAPVITSVPVRDGSLALENDNIARHFEIEDGKLRTVSVENKLAEGGDSVEFEAGSKEFVIQFKETNPENRPAAPGYTPESSDKASWAVTTNSAANAGAREGAAALAQDNNLGTIWHSNYNNGIGTPNTLPAHVEITFPTARDVQTFIYVPRQDGAQNGLIKDYKIYSKAEGEADYTEIKSGTITENPSSIQYIDLGSRLTNIKSLKFEALTAQNGRPFAAAAEFDVSDKSASELNAKQEQRMADYRQALEDHLANYQISLDKLRLADNGIERAQTSEGQRLTFTFQPYTYNNVPVTVKYVVDLKADSKFSQSHLLLSVPEADRERLTIDTIDLQSFKIKAGDKVHDFSNQGAIAEMAGYNGFYAGMGQPVYVRSFYTGSEFPLSLNKVEETGRQMISRYYSGKTIGQLGVDENGNARTWNTVIGVARSDDYQVIQQDFYDYIAKIGQDTYFRKQYNSWFDHMLNITAENIQSSFNEIERGFVNGGVSPLHSYVVDDGWQDMTTLWDFNQKFPNKLYDSSKQVRRFGSDFGLWVGPQGGYSQPGYLADNLVRQNLASKHAGVVYIGDKRYVEGMDNLFATYDREFDINYWKLDGLLLNPRPDTDPEGNFIGGGYGNMYSMTEAHERWIGLYETIRREAKDPDKMWINLTSYIPPSPWFLQWVNSIWMQNAADVDYQDHVKKAAYAHLDFGNDANEAITYRDDRYEELVNLRKWQLPFANIYNHDPVYGNTANSGKKLEPDAQGQRPKINFSAEDLRTYLFMLGTRGTGFWEFYYSYNMMDDEKWQVNGEVVNWIEANYDTLKHAKFHGGKPGHGEVYGYSAWDENTGILSIRNPINEEQDYTITLDRLVGVREGTAGMYRTTVHGDKRHDSAATTKYGDTLTLRLKPYETVIFQYSKVADTKAPELLVAKALAANTITLEFDEPILTTNAQFNVANHTVASSQLNKDLRTVTLTLADNLRDQEKVSVTYTNVADNAATANLATGNVVVTAYDNGIIEDVVTVDKATPLLHSGVEGRGTFSVTVKASLDRLNQTLAEQDGQWKLAVDNEGRIVFDVKGLQVTSAPFSSLKADDRGVADKLVTTGQEAVITAVREKNGAIKLYVDGQLHNTAFDKAKVNENLEKATLRLASPDFAGSLTRFILEDKARDFESAAQLFDQVAPRTRLVPTSIAEATAPSFDPNDGGERPASSAMDNNPSTYWASNPNKDNTLEPQRLTIELAESQEVGRVLYTPRQIANAVGNIKRAYLEYSTDGETWNRVTFTNGNEDQTITMLAGTATTPMDFSPVQAKFFRLTALETHHWSAAKVNKVVAVAELTPVVSFTPSLDLPLTRAYLKDSLYEAASINPEDYESDSLQQFATVATTAAGTYVTATNQDAIDQATANLKAALAGLVRKAQETKVTREETEVVAFETLTTDDPNLDLGQEVIEQEGVNGSVTKVYEDTAVDGQVTETRLIDIKDVTQPVSKIVRRGTRPLSTITTSHEERVVEIAFDTDRVEADSLDLGTEVVAREGVPGRVTKVYEVTFDKGIKTGERLIEEKDRVEPIHRLILVGTRPVATIRTERREVKEVIPFETLRINDENLPVGQELIVQEGRPGSLIKVYEDTFTNEIKTEERLIDVLEEEAALTQIIKVGTKIADTEEPTEPEQPVDTEEPTEPEQPVDTEESTEPEQPVDTEEPTEPEQPVDPEGPTEPEQPVDTEEPTEPEQPVDTEEPTEPEQPVDTEEPTEPEQPVDTEGPTEPEQPVDTEEPTEPEQPVDTEEPTEPEQPVDTEEPTEPEQPVDTEEPTEPEQPVDTEEPTEPTRPVDTEEPTGPEKPVDTEEPTEPEQPVDPEEPTEPEQPVDPEEPTEPEQPVDTEEPTEPEQPVDTEEATEPEQPVDTEEPTAPEQPVDTEEATEPEQPVDTEEPTDPEQPVDTEEPTGPEKPIDTEEPTEPEQPVDTEEPTEPEQPVDTEEPTGPEKPVDTEEPTEPEQPVDTEEPTKPATPTPARFLTDEATGVSVSLAEGEDANIVALRIVHKETRDVATPAVLVGKDYDLFDIELVDKDGRIIKSTKPAVVSLPIDSGKVVAEVIYLPSGDQATSLPFETVALTDGRTIAVFTAEHFSEYGIVYKPVSTSQTTTDGPATSGQAVPETSAAASPVAPVMTPAAAAPAQAEAKQETLPETGDASSALVAIGTASLLASLGLAGLKKRD